jgi:hypothetical protein
MLPPAVSVDLLQHVAAELFIDFSRQAAVMVGGGLVVVGRQTGWIHRVNLLTNILATEPHCPTATAAGDLGSVTSCKLWLGHR